MILDSLFILGFALILVVQGAALSTKYATRLSRNVGLSEYTTGFLIIAIISILPETFISINAALEEVPAFGLGVLFGSNVADLTLVFALIIFLTGRSMKIQSRILKQNSLYAFLLLLPILLGLDGFYSRAEGATLLVAGALFYYLALKQGVHRHATLVEKNGNDLTKNVCLLIASMALLLVGAHVTVTSATNLATMLGVAPVIIGMLIVGLGTTLPELFFSLKSSERHDDALAVGDILGTVLADATIVVGILALIHPFSFERSIVQVTGFFMVAAALLLFTFMQSGRTLTKREAFALFVFWLIFAAVELIVAA